MTIQGKFYSVNYVLLWDFRKKIPQETLWLACLTAAPQFTFTGNDFLLITYSTTTIQYCAVTPPCPYVVKGPRQDMRKLKKITY